MSHSYSRLIDALTQKIAQIRAGELGGGSLATPQEFSWPAAVLGVVLTLTTLVLFKIRAPDWLKRKIRSKMDLEVERPSISFYAETLDQLARVGVSRHAAQTPTELADHTLQSHSHPMIHSIAEPLDVLTWAFYQTRFGPDHHVNAKVSPNQPQQPPVEVDRALQQLIKSVDLMTTSATTTEPAS